ncbi:hypothetical protein GS399_20545 [Pedobacter sp. HMF7647]|uniref:Transposase n=1 Tax=Hufsiella arboris TaxID=2695275 RepID=A0A7K1YFH6_9SPHI|nr:transposase [Hufsiella arboris]MXV53355.1 hypothetical protein [Hufsiella arboris]
MDRPINHLVQVYSETFKRQVIEEHLNTGASQSSLLRKYNIRFNGAFQKWMLQLGYRNSQPKARYLTLSNNSALATKEKNTPTTQSLEQRIKELERLLEDEQLRSEAYSRMIDIAEKELKIPIRKKSSTK